MELFIDILSMIATIFAIILLFNIKKISEISNFIKWITLFLCIAVLCSNIFNFIDFFNGFLDGFVGGIH